MSKDEEEEEEGDEESPAANCVSSGLRIANGWADVGLGARGAFREGF